VQIAGQVPQRLVPAWKTTDPLPAAVTAVKTVVPLWAWLVLAAGILLLMVLGCSCWLCIGLRRRRQQEAAAAAAYAPHGWVVAEPVLPGEQQQQHKGESGRSKNHRHRPASSSDPHQQSIPGRGKGRRSSAVASSSHYATSTNGWWEGGGGTATVPSTPLRPSSRTAGHSPRTPSRTGGAAGYEHQQRGPAHLPGVSAPWGVYRDGEGLEGGQQQGGGGGSRGYGGRGGRGDTGEEGERDWVSGHIPSLPDMR
jgi:hypothetical protein